MTPPIEIHDAYDTQAEINDLVTREIDTLLARGDINPVIIQSIGEKIKFLGSFFSAASEDDKEKINSLLEHIDNELNRGSNTSGSDILNRLLAIGQLVDGLTENVGNKIFNDIDDINLKKIAGGVNNSTTSAPPVNTQHISTQNTSTQNGSSFSAQEFGGSASKVKSTPQIFNTTPENTRENSSINISPSEIDSYKIAIKNLKSYIEVKGLDGGTKIDEYIDLTVLLLSSSNIVKLLNTADTNGNYRFQEIIKERLTVIKEVALKIKKGETLSGDFTGDDSDHEQIHTETISQLQSLNTQSAPVLGVNEDIAETIIESLTPYQRVILNNTGFLPSQLADVSNDIPGSISGLPNNDLSGLRDLGDDFATRNYYGKTEKQLNELFGLTDIAAITNSGLSTFKASNIGEGIEKGIHVRRFLDHEITPDDLQRYVDEVNLPNLKMTEVQDAKLNAVKLLGRYVGDIRNQVEEYKNQLKAIQEGTDKDTFFMGEDMGNMEEKARAISTMLIFLEGAYNDVQGLFPILLAYAFNIVLFGNTINELTGLSDLEGLYQLPALLFFTAPPGWRLIVAASAARRNNIVRENYSGYNSSSGKTINEWLQEQDFNRREKDEVRRLHEHNRIIDNLIIHLKELKTPKSKKQIKILEAFKGSSLMVCNEATWKMLLNNRLAGGNNPISRGFSGINRMFIRGGYDAIIRRGAHFAGSKSFDKSILKKLGLSHDNFDELLDDESIRKISYDEAKSIVDTASAKIDAIDDKTLNRDAKRIKKTLLIDYLKSFKASDTISERHFLYVVSKIFDSGDSETRIEKLKKASIDKGFNLFDARSKFENIEKGEVDLDTAKSSLVRDIKALPDDVSDIKDKLKSKAEKFNEKTKLDDFEKDVFKPYRTFIRDILDFNNIPKAYKEEIFKSLLNDLSDDPKAGIKEKRKELSILRGEIPNINIISDDNIKKSLYEKITLCFTNEDDGKLAEKINTSIADVPGMISEIEALKSPANENILKMLQGATSRLSKKSSEFSNIKEGLENISKIQGSIKRPATDMSNDFVNGLKNSLDTLLSEDSIKWGEIASLAQSIKTEEQRINIAAGAKREAGPRTSETSTTTKPELTTTDIATRRGSIGNMIDEIEVLDGVDNVNDDLVELRRIERDLNKYFDENQIRRTDPDYADLWTKFTQRREEKRAELRAMKASGATPETAKPAEVAAKPENTETPRRRYSSAELSPEQQTIRTRGHELVERVEIEIALQRDSWSFAPSNLKREVTKMVKSGKTFDEVQSYILERANTDIPITNIRTYAELGQALVKATESMNLGTTRSSIDLDSLRSRIDGGGSVSRSVIENFWKGLKEGKIKLKL